MRLAFTLTLQWWGAIISVMVTRLSWVGLESTRTLPARVYGSGRIKGKMGSAINKTTFTQRFRIKSSKDENGCMKKKRLEIKRKCSLVKYIYMQRDYLLLVPMPFVFLTVKYNRLFLFVEQNASSPIPELCHSGMIALCWIIKNYKSMRHPLLSLWILLHHFL